MPFCKGIDYAMDGDILVAFKRGLFDAGFYFYESLYL